MHAGGTMELESAALSWAPCDHWDTACTDPPAEMAAAIGRVHDMDVDSKTVTQYREKKQRMEVLSRRIDELRSGDTKVSMEWKSIRDAIEAFAIRVDLSDDTAGWHQLDEAVREKLRLRATTSETEMRRLIPERDALATELSELHAALLSVSREFNDLVKSCPVCYERHVDRCLPQCGHTLCADCVSKVFHADGRCPVCRTPCNSVIQIYLG